MTIGPWFLIPGDTRLRRHVVFNHRIIGEALVWKSADGIFEWEAWYSARNVGKNYNLTLAGAKKAASRALRKAMRK